MNQVNLIKQLEILSKGNLETKKKLIQLFVFQTSNDIEKINDCLKIEDWNELKQVAHKLKSSFLYLDMPRPTELTEILFDTSGVNPKSTKKQAKELIKICNETLELFLNIS